MATNYRVGVSLALRAAGYTTQMSGAASQTQRFGGLVERTAGRSSRALRSVSGAAEGVRGVLQRTAGAARGVGTATRRMADTMGGALRSARRRVDGLIQRFRELRLAGRTAGAGVAGGVGRLAAAAGGAYGVSRVVSGEAELSRKYTDLAVKAGLDEAQREDMRRRIERAAEQARIPRQKLLDAVFKEYELSGDLEPALADLLPTARVLAIDPATAGTDLGAVRAQFGSFGLDDAATRERAMLQMVLASAAGALSVADLARSAGEAMAAQTEVFGNRDWESFLVAAQRGMTGFQKAEVTMTALTAFAKRMSLERPELEKLIGPVDPATTSVTEIAQRLMAAARGDVSNLKGTPFGTEETVGILAGLTGAKGQEVGANVVAGITGSMEELVARTQDTWRRQTEEPAAQMELGRDLAQRDVGNQLLGIWRPATQAIVSHLPQIEVAAMGLLAAFGVGKLAGWARGGYLWARGRGRAGAGGGALAGAAASTVATMRVGTLIVSSMPGGAGGGAILGPDGRPARRPGGTAARTGGGRGLLQRTAGLSRGLPLAAAGIGAIDVGANLLAGDGRGAAQSAAGAVGSFAATAGLAKAGAMLGTLIAPGIGTAVGGLLGAAAGGLGGYWFGHKVAGYAIEAAAIGEDETAEERAQPRRSVRRRGRRRVAGYAPADDQAAALDEDETAEERAQPRRSVRRRGRRRVAGYAPADDQAAALDEDETAEEGAQPRRSVRRRGRRRELETRDAGPRIQLAPRQAAQVVNVDDHSRIDVGGITVQAATDPEETAEAVWRTIDSRAERQRRDRERRIREAVEDVPEADPVL